MIRVIIKGSTKQALDSASKWQVKLKNMRTQKLPLSGGEETYANVKEEYRTVLHEWFHSDINESDYPPGSLLFFSSYSSEGGVK